MIDTVEHKRVVLVIKLGAFGDLLMADGALFDIRRAYPDSTIVLLTRESFAGTYADHPAIDQIIVDENRPRWRLVAMHKLGQRLRQLNPVIGHDLQNNRRSRFYRRWLLKGFAFSALDQNAAYQPANNLPDDMPGQHAAQLAAADINVERAARPSPRWLITPMHDWLAMRKIILPFVLLLPGSSSANHHKRWPHYRALADRLIAAGHRVVTVPGPDENDLEDFPGAVLKHEDGKSLSLQELAGIADLACAAVGNDSGPTHLAAMLDKPGLMIFGGGNAHAQMRRTGVQHRTMKTLLAANIASIDVDQAYNTLINLIESITYNKS